MATRRLISSLLDAFGRPFHRATLEEPQTAPLAHLQRELQSHPTRGLTPSRLAAILDAAENGDITEQAALFEDMEEKDGHIASEMGKRRRALLVDWTIVPPVNPSPTEKRAAEQMVELMGELPDFAGILFDTTDAIGKGFSCQEIEWHRTGKFWLPKTVTHRPQGWFQLHRGYTQEIRLRTNNAVDGVLGDALQAFGWITHIHKAKSGYLERSALFRQLVWTYLFKNYSVGDLAEFLEIYGIPLRLGKYPPSATEKDKAVLMRALRGIGHNAAGIVPEGMLLEFHDAATGDPDAFALMIDWCEKNQSKVILGGTLTSGADGKTSTNALGNVHNEVRKDLRDSDLRQVVATLSRDLVYPIAALAGLAPDGIQRAPRLQLNVGETEDLSVFAEALPKLVAIGVRPTVQWAHEQLGIPMAQDGEAVLGSALGAAPESMPGQAALSAQPPVSAPGAKPLKPLVAAATVDQLGQDLAPAVDGWIQSIRDLVERAKSMDEIRDGLEALIPDMTLDQYAAAMAEALRAVDLSGRHDVMRETDRG